ncbi:MAG: class I SAM-dependent methyltransferase, partial [Chloroflexi bacterium]|nr:class I SAM-dependent methyltransferase [Chloroflexota bacterium]
MSENEDVAKVLARLKEEIRDRKAQSAEPTPSEAQVKLRQVYATARVNPHLPIGWPKLPPGVIPKIVAIAQKVVRRLLRWYINPIVEQQNAYNAAATAVLEAQTMQIERLEAQMMQLEQLRTEMSRMAQLEDALRKEAEMTQVRLQRLERSYRTLASAGAPDVTRSDSLAPSDALALDYFRLELQLRDPHLLRERQSSYVEYFEGRQNVLDIGCGRGEFVEMLLQRGISARGIDLDP